MQSWCPDCPMRRFFGCITSKIVITPRFLSGSARVEEMLVLFLSIAVQIILGTTVILQRLCGELG